MTAPLDPMAEAEYAFPIADKAALAAVWAMLETRGVEQAPVADIIVTYARALARPSDDTRRLDAADVIVRALAIWAAHRVLPPDNQLHMICDQAQKYAAINAGAAQ